MRDFYHKPTAAFLESVIQNMPEISGEVMEIWLQHPNHLREALTVLCFPDIHIIHLWNASAPDGFEKKAHLGPSGPLDWSDAPVALWRGKAQENGKRMGGMELLNELTHAPVLSAAVLEYLLKHPKLISKEWNGKNIFFWGTLYRHVGSKIDFVRYLHWRNGTWHSDMRPLANEWGDNDYAVILSV